MAEIITWLMVAYFLAVHGIYLMLSLLAAQALYRNQRYREIEALPLSYSLLSPPISVLVPAYNEETTITATVESLLQLAYAEFEVVVINDGSRDQTLQVLIERFGLLPFPEAYRVQIPTQEVRGIYRSPRHPNLRVIDKANGGKADSLNAGINASRYPLFCGVDADSILERDSLQKVVKPFMRSPDMVATGGTIRATNGCDVRGGDLLKIDLPRNRWALFQVMEYLRAFLFGRLGWSSINAMLIISGAFGLFRKETVVSVGGYRPNTIGEDMELIVRLHRVLRERRQAYRIQFIADPVCWTEAPEDWRSLRNQRVRWQRGLAESLSLHWRLMFSRHGGAPGWIAFPFMLLFELLGPILELGGLLFMAWAWWAGFVDWQAFALFMFAALGLGIMLSASGLLLEELGFHLYPRSRHVMRLALVAFAENFGYRQLNTWWRLVGLWQWATGRKSRWGHMVRKGLDPAAR